MGLCVLYSYIYYYCYYCYGMMDSYSVSYGAGLRYRTVTTYTSVPECCPGYEDPAGGINCERKHAYLTVYMYNYYY